MAPTPRQSWSDHSLDELNKKVDDGFDGLEKRMDRVETKVEALDKKVDALDEKVAENSRRVEQDIRELRGEIKDQSRVLLAGAIVIVASVLGSNLL